MKPIGVIHLVWVPAGCAPLERFLASYHAHPGGMAHDLIVIFNGHHTRDALAPFQALLKDVPHTPLILDRPNQDLTSYRIAARRVGHEYLCFLNSYSILQGNDWLAKFMAAMRQDKTGIVGATGSWESSYTHFMERYYPDGGRPLYKQPLDAARKLRKRIDFDAFPNPHVRTNAFLLPRARLLALRFPTVRSKPDAYRLESGKRGLTRQILRAGLEARLVGLDGKIYATAEWAQSNTFRQGRQENLLVTDNQTDVYADSDLPTRQMLARHSWGAQGYAIP